MVYCEMALVGVANWCLDYPGIRHTESSPCCPKSPPCLPESSPHRISLSHRCLGERRDGGVPPARVRAGQSFPGDFQDNSIPALWGVPSLRVGFQTLVPAECWGTILVPGPFWNICLLNYIAETWWASNTLFAFFKWYPVLFTHFSPFQFRLARCTGSVAGKLSFNPKLKLSTKLCSCWLCPYEQLPFKFPRRRRLVACFAVLTENEYELKGLHLRAVSFFFAYEDFSSLI